VYLPSYAKRSTKTIIPLRGVANELSKKRFGIAQQRAIDANFTEDRGLVQKEVSLGSFGTPVPDTSGVLTIKTTPVMITPTAERLGTILTK
jgi:hypothetical protein